MTIDPTAPAASLLASSQEISPVERQNRYGMRHLTIPGLEPDKFVTILAIRTHEEFSAQQFFEILELLRNSYGVESMQTAFAAVVPDFGTQYRNNLHLTAHLRADASANGADD